MAEQRNVFQEDTNDKYAELNDIARRTGMSVATVSDLYLAGYKAKIENDRVTFVREGLTNESRTDESSDPEGL